MKKRWIIFILLFIIALIVVIILINSRDTKKLICRATDDSSTIKTESELVIKVKDKKVKDMDFTVDMIFPREQLSQRYSYINTIKQTKPYMNATIIDEGIKLVTEMEDGSFIGIDAEQEVTIAELKQVLEIQGYTCE